MEGKAARHGNALMTDASGPVEFFVFRRCLCGRRIGGHTAFTHPRPQQSTIPLHTAKTRASRGGNEGSDVGELRTHFV